ncbi:NUDIX domain-containing protein [uncultured Thermanaerothrix sp.]|uniref:NUDIX domain-containing protein n=1 Tax=uncultured Thermanaerothrix sp. TaxID=1195149 RepID=UPI00260D6BEB|nr:NUDIX domain-containing protein [uncultured Thermanaerothrix sp.]
MARDPIPTWFFVVVIVRQGEQFLLIQESRHGQTWYFPAGRVEPGETILEAAYRETLEESGIPIELDGLLRIEYTSLPVGAVRMRFFFLAHPATPAPPKSQPDAESLQARWITLEQLYQYPLRSPEVQKILESIASGAPAYPLSLLTSQRTPHPPL